MAPDLIIYASFLIIRCRLLRLQDDSGVYGYCSVFIGKYRIKVHLFYLRVMLCKIGDFQQHFFQSSRYWRVRNHDSRLTWHNREYL